MNTQQIIDEANTKASKVTRSVLVLARVMGVTPAKLAEALLDEGKNAKFQAKFSSAYVELAVEKTVTDEE